MGIHAVPLRQVTGGGVTSMTSGKSWSIKDLDPRIRKMAQEAARKAGISLEDWIRAAVARQAGQAGQPAPRDAGVEAANDTLAELGDRVRSMSPQARSGRTDAERAELDEIVRRIAREFQDADETARSTVEGSDDGTNDDGDFRYAAPRGTEQRGRPVSEPGMPQPDEPRHAAPREADIEIVRAERPRPRSAPGDVLRAPHRHARQPDVLTAAIADISHRQSFLAGYAPRIDDELSSAVLSLRADIAVLNDRVATLTERSFDERANSDGASLRAEKAALAGQASMAAIAASLGEIRIVLDDIAEPRHGVDANGMATLVVGLAELRAKVEGMERAGRQQTESLRRLEARVENVARVDPVALVRSFEARIDRLSAQVEAIVRAPSRTVPIDEVRQEIAAVRLDLATRNAKSMDAVEKRIRDLIDHVSAASRSHDARNLAALEQRIDSLAGDLAHALPRTELLDQIEAHITDLKESLAEGREDAVEVARLAAQEAVRELQADGDRGVVAELRKDLDCIRELIATGDHADAFDDEDVHATVVAVAERIESLAEEPELGAAAVFAEEPEDPEYEARFTDEAYEPEAVAEPAADFASVAVPAPASEPPRHRDLGLVREVAAAVPAEDRIGDRRVDFIAAARRAAQAAVSETTAASAPAEERADGESPFARIGQAIRARRRPLLLAAAALVLAIGAYQTLIRPMANAGAQPGGPDVVFVQRSGSIASADDALPIPPSAAPEARRVGGPDAYSAPSPAVPGVGSDEIRAAAAAGDPYAAYEVANRYADGRGTLRDLGQAAMWYQRAADAGLVPAIYRLASLYERGQGVPKDVPRAMALYQRAAEQGNPGAMYNLAVLLNAGAAQGGDTSAAMHWFHEAADYGVKDSQYNLGVIYSRGIGVSANREEAYKWFAVAAASGDQDAAAERDRLGARLGPNELSRARAVSSAFRPKSPPPGAVDIATGSAFEAPEASSSLSFESRQAMVKTAQALLIDRGYDPGPADGVEGPKTVQAVRAFQRSIGAPSTGQIDATLVGKLQQRIG